MQVPTVGSVVKVRAKFRMGPSMIPPRPDFVLYEGKILPAFKWLNDREFCLSGDKDWPIRVINLESVDDIELISGEMKEIKTDIETFIVDGSKGAKYTVTRNRQGWSCTCTGFQYRRQCKHVTELSK